MGYHEIRKQFDAICQFWFWKRIFLQRKPQAKARACLYRAFQATHSAPALLYRKNPFFNHTKTANVNATLKMSKVARIRSRPWSHKKSASLDGFARASCASWTVETPLTVFGSLAVPANCHQMTSADGRHGIDQTLLPNQSRIPSIVFAAHVKLLGKALLNSHRGIRTHEALERITGTYVRESWHGVECSGYVPEELLLPCLSAISYPWFYSRSIVS